MTTRTTIRALRTRTKRSRTRAALLCGFALAAALGTSALPPTARGLGAAGSTTKVPPLRTIEGIVCSKSGTPIQGAVVYLQDTKSLAVKSYLSDAQGRFHFRHLSMSLDYDLWAELKGKRSKTKSISQFNSKADLRYKLKVSEKK